MDFGYNVSDLLWIWCYDGCGRSQEGGGPEGPGTPNPIPLKILRIKRVRTTHALRIRLIELW